MINDESIKDTERRRLAWRCRRGMLELDIVLQRFVEEQFHGLSVGELKAFDEMLDLPDNQFWALVSDKNKSHKEPSLQSVLCKMRML
ncbi:MAG: succinate dehydrogenase assembly factor 2 [Methylophilaceae bacterium]